MSFHQEETDCPGFAVGIQGRLFKRPVVAKKSAESVTIRGNTLLGSAGILAAGDDSVIADNRVGAGGIRADGHGAEISGNTVLSGDGDATPGYAIAAFGDDASVAGNVIEANPYGSLSGILIAGEGGDVVSNIVTVANMYQSAGNEVSAIELRGARLKQEGAPVQLIFPAEGLGWEMNAFAIMKGTKNQQAAQQLAEWAASEKAMRIYGASRSLVAIPSMAAAIPHIPTDITDRIMKQDFAWASANNQRILDEWEKRYGTKAEPKKK